MVSRITVIICLLAALVQTVLGCTSTSWHKAVDAVYVLLLMAPYLVLALFAHRQRGNGKLSWVLLAVAAALSAWGLYFIAEDSYRYHTDPHHEMTQRVGVFIVLLVQWAVVLLVGLTLLIMRWRSRPR